VGQEPLTGAAALVLAAARSGVRVCFANPGATEAPLVAALDRVRDVRAVLGLHENVCTGAADGYARITGRAAMTVLHLGPGLANGLANLHNARRAHTPLVNVVGDHPSWHLPFDPPLTSDIAALAATVGAVYPVAGRAEIGQVTRTAIDQAHRRAGVCTVIVPADHQRSHAPDTPTEPTEPPPCPRVGGERIGTVATRLRAAGPRAVLLLGGNGLTVAGQVAAGRIGARTGAARYSETFPARAERGGGLPPIDRLPYFPETVMSALRHAEIVVTAGADDPVAFFGHPGLPSVLAPPGSIVRLAGPREDAEQALCELADLVDGGGADAAPVVPATAVEVPDASEPLSGRTAGQVVAACLPAGAIVSIEGTSCSYSFYAASVGAPAHSVLTNTGGAIGQGLPCALGAAIAAPDRPVIALESDGSGLYTAQALWTMSRERADVVVLIAANHAYGVLQTEFERQGLAERGPQADSLFSLADPKVDWVALAHGFGVPARRASRVADLRSALTEAIATGGPHLIEMAL
jgi:acetolactate synthase-1/2/3 large subunit